VAGVNELWRTDSGYTTYPSYGRPIHHGSDTQAEQTDSDEELEDTESDEARWHGGNLQS
jgi:hypothetical protein